jgi:hypothetical protein
MRKAWEETWEVQRYVIELAGDAGHQLGQFVDDVDDPEWPSCDRDRAQLAAAAPEMARLLLELACYRDCDFCEQKIDRGFVPGSAGDIDTDLHPYWHTHSSRCPLRVVLEKAGIPTAVSGSALKSPDGT